MLVELLSAAFPHHLVAGQKTQTCHAAGDQTFLPVGRMEAGPLRNPDPLPGLRHLRVLGEGRGAHERRPHQAAIQPLGLAAGPQELANRLRLMQLGQRRQVGRTGL